MSYLPQLQTFLAVYRLGSITAASLELGMTQPGATQHIQSLENKFGKSLFTRQARGVKPTVFADDLAKKIATQIDDIETVISGLSANASDLAGDVYIGGPVEYISSQLLAKLTQLNLHNIQCHFSFGGKERIYALLENNEIDLAITASKIESKDYQFDAIAEEKLILVAGIEFAKTHQLAKLSNAELLNKPLIAYDIELPLIRDYFSLNLTQALQIKPTFIVSDLRSIVDLVVSNFGFSVLPEYLCEREIVNNKLQVLSNEIKQITNTLYLVSSKRTRQSQRVKFVKNFINNS